MPFRPPLAWLVAALIATSFALTLAAAGLHKSGSAVAAAIFAAAIVAAALWTNVGAWRRRFVPTSAAEIVTPRIAIWHNAFLTMLAYLWGGITLLAVYLGAGLIWQHGWQYGTIMLIIAACHAVYLHRISNPDDSYASARAIDVMSTLAKVQAIAIAIALAWLMTSGKLATPKGDWAANLVFLAGGFAVMCTSLIGVKTHTALRERRAA